MNKREWEDNGPKLYNLILQQCPPARVLNIVRQPGWEPCHDQRDVIKLLQMFHTLTHKRDTKKKQGW